MKNPEISEFQMREPEPSLPTKNIPDFIDKSKDPQHYIEQILYNETSLQRMV